MTPAVDRGNWLTAFETAPAIGRWMVAKPQWGTKFVCDNCGARFYDLNRRPATCPKCDTVRTTGRSSKPRREAGAAPVIEKPETKAPVEGKEVPVDDLKDGEKDEADTTADAETDEDAEAADDEKDEADGAVEADKDDDDDADDKEADEADDDTEAETGEGSDRP